MDNNRNWEQVLKTKEEKNKEKMFNLSWELSIYLVHPNIIRLPSEQISAVS